MAFGHEERDVYRAAIKCVGWASRYCEKLKGHHLQLCEALSADDNNQQRVTARSYCGHADEARTAWVA